MESPVTSFLAIVLGPHNDHLLAVFIINVQSLAMNIIKERGIAPLKCKARRNLT